MADVINGRFITTSHYQNVTLQTCMYLDVSDNGTCDSKSPFLIQQQFNGTKKRFVVENNEWAEHAGIS